MRRVVEDLLRRAHLDQPAEVHHAHVIRHEIDHGKVMADKQVCTIYTSDPADE